MKLVTESIPAVDSIKNWPIHDRPREKLLTKGEKALSDSELLAIVLRNGTRGVSATDLARNIMLKFGSFRNLSNAQENDWNDFRGVGRAKIAQIKASMEIGRRLWENSLTSPKIQLNNAKTVAGMLMPRMRDAKKEIFTVLFLDSQNRLIESSELSTGTVNEVRPIIREIFHEALKKSASGLICVHNHPSEDIKPSVEDINLTREIQNAGKVMNIVLRDHVIIAGEQYFSFADEGLIND